TKAETEPPPWSASWRAAPRSSNEAGVRLPLFTSAMTRIPGIRGSSLNQLRGPELLGEGTGLLFGRIAFDDLDVDFDLGLVERLERHDAVGGAELVGRKAKVCGAPDLHGLLGGHHDLAKLRVAGPAELVRDGDDRGKVGFDLLDAVVEHALHRHLGAIGLDGLRNGDDREAQDGTNAERDDTHVPVGGGAAHENQVVFADFLDGRGQRVGRLEVVDIFERRVGQQDTFVGAHSKRVLDRIASAIGAEGDDGDLAATDGILDAKGGFGRLGVVGVYDRGDALRRDDLLRSLVDLKRRSWRFRVGDLLNAYDDVHAVAAPPALSGAWVAPGMMRGHLGNPRNVIT